MNSIEQDEAIRELQKHVAQLQEAVLQLQALALESKRTKEHYGVSQ